MNVWSAPGGVVILDSSIILNKVARDDLRTYYVPADAIAEEEGNTRGANMVLLGAYLAATKKMALESVLAVVEHSFTGSKARYAESNKRLVQKGFEYIRQTEPA